MPKTKISEFSSTPANNTDIDSINISEGCAPSGINDAIRELMSQLKDWQSGTSNDPMVIGSSGSLTLNQGTANGVTYLNGSKVVTSGSALVFDGSNLGLGVTPSAYSFGKAVQVNGAALIGDASTFRARMTANAYHDGSWRYLQTNYALMYSQDGSSGTHAWNISPSGTAGNAITFTQAMTLDASGNLGVGTTSPTSRLEVRYNSAAPISWGGTGSFNNNYGSLTWGTDLAIVQANAGYSLVFNTNGNNERARIDSSGNLLVGTTSQISSGKAVISFGGTFFNGLVLSESANISSATFLAFNNGSTIIGSVSRVGGTSAVVYNTTSDYRLKTVTGSVTGQGARIDALKPIDYLWTEGGQQARGFLAHDFQTIYPNSVTGEKDAVDADGNPKYQSMQAATSEVIADLVAEIQSLRKRLADAGIA